MPQKIPSKISATLIEKSKRPRVQIIFPTSVSRLAIKLPAIFTPNQKTLIHFHHISETTLDVTRTPIKNDVVWSQSVGK